MRGSKRAMGTVWEAVGCLRDMGDRLPGKVDEMKSVGNQEDSKLEG